MKKKEGKVDWGTDDVHLGDRLVVVGGLVRRGIFGEEEEEYGGRMSFLVDRTFSGVSRLRNFLLRPPNASTGTDLLHPGNPYGDDA